VARVAKALTRPKRGKPTKPNKMAKEKRIRAKKQRGEVNYCLHPIASE